MGAQNKDRPYARQIKPFGFLNIAFVHPLERPANEQHMVLIAPFSTNPADWLQQAWTNRYSAAEWTITLEPSNGMERDGVVTAKSYRDMLAEYATHPEYKSADRDDQRCGRRTTGLLRRRHIVVSTVTHIGKEANALDDAGAGLLQRADEAQTAYDDTDTLRFQQRILPRLRELGVREVARRTGHSVGAVQAVLSGRSIPRVSARARYASSVSSSAP
jgi:hypothetical protein